MLKGRYKCTLIYPDLPYLYDHCQVRWITMIILLQWHLKVIGIYKTSIKQVAPEVDVLKAEKTGIAVPCRPVSTAKSAYNGHVSIKTGPQNNGRSWSGLIPQHTVWSLLASIPWWIRAVLAGKGAVLAEKGGPIQY